MAEIWNSAVCLVVGAVEMGRWTVGLHVDRVECPLTPSVRDEATT